MGPLYILEHRYRSVTKDGTQEGSTLDGRPRPARTVAAIVVKGEARNVKVRLGEETIEAKTGTTPLDPPRQLPAGCPVTIDFDGDGSVEIAAEREVNTQPGHAVPRT